MCDPVTLTALTVAATVVTAGSQIYAGQAAYQQGKYESQIAERNAKLEEASREDAFSRRNIDQMRLWRNVTQKLGQERAEAAGQGLDVNFGSVADIQQDTLLLGMEDSSTLNSNYDKEIKGYDINASNYRAEGVAARYRAKTERMGSYLQATGSLLAGASQVGKINMGPRTSSLSSSGGGYRIGGGTSTFFSQHPLGSG
jgi:hypothetical protein